MSTAAANDPKKKTWARALRRWALRSAIALLVLAVALWITWLLLPKPELFPDGLTYSRVVLDRDGHVLFVTLTPDGKYRLPAKLAELSPELIAATMEMEDRRFYSHMGADPRSLVRAAWGVVSGQHLGGGSTLTMQYARLRFGLDTRSWWGKAKQIFRAVQLERHYGKQELMEAYFTLAPYGGNVEGAPAASLLWCGKPASELSLREAAALSVIPQSPTKRKPRLEGNPSLAAAEGRLMARLRAARGETVQALDGEFCLRPAGPVPRRAPHYARRVLTEHPGEMVVRTKLDSMQQQTLEKSLADFLSRERSRGLRNAAAVLVHAPTGEVRAYVGSADFYNDAIHGQVDGVTARRSPGSALKPFIYALSLDAGLIHPSTLLDDAPRRFGGYNPENSDRGFLGPIPAAEALRRSRNVPAVELASRLPGGGLDAYLRSAGVALPRPRGDYGLSLALGGAEVSLEDLAHLYTGLARQAVAQTSTPRWLGGTTSLSPAACWLTLNALHGSEAPTGLSWKTGTSHGFRDAWACGVMGEWVLCVWVGNFDGKPMPGLFARETASPLLFQSVTRLGLRANPAPRPATVTSVRMCAVSGELAGPFCAHCVKGPFIAGVSPITTCAVHREVVLDAQGRRLANDNGTGRREVCEFWPAHRLEQFRRAGLPRAEPPPLAPGAVADHAAAPRIVSPQPRLTYVLRPGTEGKNAIPLEANAGTEVRKIFWFAGSRYLGESTPAQPLLWQPEPGKWTIQALDDAGRSSSMVLRVVAE